MSLLAKFNKGRVLQSFHSLDAFIAGLQYITMASESTLQFSSQGFEDA